MRNWFAAAFVLVLLLGGLVVRYLATTPPVTAEKERPVTQSPPAEAPKVQPPEPAKPAAADVAKAADAAPRTFRDCDVCPAMVALSGGTFMMGSPANDEGRDADEGPQHRVTVKPFAIGQYEVTFDEWDACVAAGGCNGYRPGDQGWGRGKRPVISVAWDDAKAYVAWLTKKTGKPYRLPSEAEWEYAAHAGTTTPFAFGATLTKDQANFGLILGKTQPIGSYPPNAWGVYDLHGNVWEWVEDCWHDNYQGAPVDGSAWAQGKCSSRVVRGGSWNYHPVYLTSAERSGVGPVRYLDKGFLVSRTLN
jgi:formylglycine-generating enzyme required for sulfatase activity